jgi:hypothetical protein
MTHALLVLALLWPMAHSEAGPVYVAPSGHVDVASRLAMGPDPGGHNGETVTPTTTRTGQPVENGQAPKSESAGSSKGEAAKQGTPPRGSAASGQGDRR